MILRALLLLILTAHCAEPDVVRHDDWTCEIHARQTSGETSLHAEFFCPTKITGMVRVEVWQIFHDRAGDLLAWHSDYSSCNQPIDVSFRLPITDSGGATYAIASTVITTPPFNGPTGRVECMTQAFQD